MNNYWLIIVLLGSMLLGARLQAQEETTRSTPLDSSLLVDYYLLDRALEQNNQYLEKSIELRLLLLQEQGLPTSTFIPFKQATQDWNTVFDEVHLKALRNYNFGKPSSPYRVQSDVGNPFEEADIRALVKALDQLKTKQLHALKGLWMEHPRKGTIFTNPKTQEQEISALKEQMTRLHQAIHQIDNREWQASTFNNRPSFLILILLRKVQNEALLQQILLVDYLDQQFVDLPLFKTGMDIEVSANKQRYLQGEKRELVIKTFPLVKNKVQIRVNGVLVNNHKGVATFKASAISLGAQQDTIAIRYTNAETGQPQIIQKIIDYTVDRPQLYISANKMNVLYAGIENPIVATHNLFEKQPFQIEAYYSDCTEDCKVELKQQGHAFSRYYKVLPKKPGRIKIVLKDSTTEGRSYAFKFRVYPIVDPVFRLGRKKKGTMSRGELNAQLGITAWVSDPCFNFSLRPEITHYKMTHQSGVTTKEYVHDKARFSNEIRAALLTAKEGDVYTFSEIACLYPYETTARTANDIQITIK